MLVASLLGGHSHGGGGGGARAGATPPTNKESQSSTDENKKGPGVGYGDDDDDDDFHDNQIIKGPACCNKDPVARLEKIQNMADQLEHNQGGDNDDMNLDDDIEDTLRIHLHQEDTVQSHG